MKRRWVEPFPNITNLKNNCWARCIGGIFRILFVLHDENALCRLLFQTLYRKIVFSSFVKVLYFTLFHSLFFIFLIMLESLIPTDLIFKLTLFS